MERIEIFESRAKNIFWAIFMIFVGLFFVVVSFSDGVTERSQIFYVGMGILFILGSLLFFWSAFSKTLVAIISDEGIWTQSFDKTVLWDEIETVKVEDDMMVVELVNVNKSFPDCSKISRALLKRCLVDLSRTNVQIPHLYKTLDERLGQQ